MSRYRGFHLSLRAHSVAICAGFFLLITLLVSRVYSLAQAQVQQMRMLAQGELQAHRLLPEMEALQKSIRQSELKLSITRDRTYSEILAKEAAEMRGLQERLLQSLRVSDPGM